MVAAPRGPGRLGLGAVAGTLSHVRGRRRALALVAGGAALAAAPLLGGRRLLVGAAALTPAASARPVDRLRRARAPGLALLAGRALAAALLGVDEDIARVGRLGGQHAVLAVKLGQRHLHVGRLQLLEHLARHRVRAARAAELLRLLARGLRRGHVGEVHADGLAALEAQHDLLLGRVVLDDLALSQRRVDDGVALGRAALEVAVGLELVAQAAHEAPARARDLGRVEREVLLLGHADAHRVEARGETTAAELLAAVAVAADDGGLLAHADLAHVDAHVELAREITHELAEVHAVLGGEVADGLLLVEEELDAHGLHLKSGG